MIVDRALELTDAWGGAPAQYAEHRSKLLSVSEPVFLSAKCQAPKLLDDSGFGAKAGPLHLIHSSTIGAATLQFP